MRFMPPPNPTILMPIGGWEEHTYYIVEASFSSSNPTRRYLFYSGFLNGAPSENGRPVGPDLPGSYNGFLNLEEPLEIKDAYYFFPIHKLAVSDLDCGASTMDNKYNLDPQYNPYRKEFDE